jgi:hypothetical protein
MSQARTCWLAFLVFACGSSEAGPSGGSAGRAPQVTSGGGALGQGAVGTSGAGTGLETVKGGSEAGGHEASSGGNGGNTQDPSRAGNGAGGVEEETGPHVTWTASDYASRKWARWPIPNPVSLALPHPMAFSDGGETVLDEVTGLVWEKTPVAMTMTWQAALDYCAGKGEGWSLPTRIELSSIVDNTQSGAKVGSKLFVFEPKPGWTWASTPWVVNSRKTVDPPLSWFINLSQGDSNNSLSQLAASAYGRCVKVPPTQELAETHYTIAEGEVTDNYTGLAWQQLDSGATPSLTAAEAAEYCQALELNGKVWRLPSLNELASVVDDVPSGNVSPSVDHAAFPKHSKDQWYWSASPHGGSSSEQWTLSFEDGFTKHQPTSTLAIAQCVHD